MRHMHHAIRRMRIPVLANVRKGFWSLAIHNLHSRACSSSLLKQLASGAKPGMAAAYSRSLCHMLMMCNRCHQPQSLNTPSWPSWLKVSSDQQGTTWDTVLFLLWLVSHGEEPVSPRLFAICMMSCTVTP